ncbi:ciliogenesis and planar polarity effector 2 [Liasis olivaceus]
MLVPPGSVVDPEWHRTEEGRRYLAALLRRQRRRAFGLLERPALPPRAAADVASYKVFVAGRSGVGKTALVARLAGLEPPAAHHETAGIQTTVLFWPARLRESGRALFFRLCFWDCGEAALRRFGHLLPACREKADALLLVFSFADRASFDDLPGQIARAAGGAGSALRIVVGTKCDQLARADVTEADLRAFGRAWGLPVLRAKGAGGRGPGPDPDGYAGLAEAAPLLNGLVEHLWRRDQVAAGLVAPPPPPAPPEGAAP